MFPLFYVDLTTKQTSFLPRPGYKPIFRQKKGYAVQLAPDEYQPCEDETWVLKTFRNMLFLEQCYWSS